MSKSGTRVRVITFTDEDGKLWALKDFCFHYCANERAVRHTWYKLGRPETIETRELLQSAQHGGQNGVVVTVLLPDGTRKTFATAKDMCEFAEAWSVENGCNPEHIKSATLYDRWRDRLSRARVFKIKSLFARKPRLTSSEIVVLDVPKGDLEHLGNKRSVEKERLLNTIPGPSRYELEHFNDAGKFGAGKITRSNFAGRTKGGGPIYTGR